MARLIIYPHGLGDIILLTPALRALAGHGYHVAVLKRFAGTEILDHCPHIDRVHYVLPDPWNDDGGINATKAAGCKLACQLRLKPTWVWHRPGKHKIHENFRQLGTTHPDLSTEVYIPPLDLAATRENMWPHADNYGFLHCDTGMPGLSTAAKAKNFPAEIGREWLLQAGCSCVVQVGVELTMQRPMSQQFMIMARAAKICVADSVFYHAAHAMKQRVDFAYFGRGKAVWDRVRPLHDHEEVVSWEYPPIRSSSAAPGRASPPSRI